MQGKKKLIVLIILDGWGYREEREGNAIALAEKPNYNYYWSKYPHTFLKACGTEVGLPDGQMGNSEVGHLNIGAGRIVLQELPRINKAIEDGSFYTNRSFQDVIEKTRNREGDLHLMGLVSDGGVHSHQEHIYALLELAKRKGVQKVFIHSFLDGRDVPPDSAVNYLKALKKKCREKGAGVIASVMGRYYAMDRDRRWDRTERAYLALVEGLGKKTRDPVAAVEKLYKKNITDEFVEPHVVIDENGKPLGRVKDGDGVIFFNFRADRARQLTRAFVDDNFYGFQRRSRPRVNFVSMTMYDAALDIPAAFPPQELHNTLGEVLAANGLKQLRIAETEKYAHLTFFFNGGREKPYPGEERILVPSPKVSTYDLQPEMSAAGIAREAERNILGNDYDIIFINFANPDMVGHTGNLEAAVKAIEAVDDCLGKIFKAVVSQDGTMLVTADHGNAEQMIGVGGGEHTAHTSNDVPFILIDRDAEGKILRRGSLRDVAPTVLDLLGLGKPPEMTGDTLLQSKGSFL